MATTYHVPINHHAFSSKNDKQNKFWVEYQAICFIMFAIKKFGT